MKFSLQITAVFLLFICTNSVAQRSYEVQFKDFKFQPEENISLFDPIDIAKSEVVSGNFYRFVQFYDLLKNEDIKTINNSGIQLLSYVSNQTYLISIPQEISKTDLVNLNIRSIWKTQQNLKASLDIKNKSLPSWAIDGNNALLLIKYYKDLEQDGVINQLLENEIEVIDYNGINNFLKISIPLDRINELTDFPFIEYVDPIMPPDVKDDRRGRSLHRVNKLDPNIAGARNYTGKGINVLVRDDGRVFEHIDFRGRMDQTFAGPSIGGHGDGVAGIFAGAGNLNPVNRGMAHESTIHVINYQANFMDETMSLFNNRDVIVTNSSYSNGCNAGYTNSTQIVDQQTYDNPTLMHVFSAGNSGQGAVDDDGNSYECGYGAGLTWGNITGGHKQGKNVIATANLNYRGEIMASSSRGPAFDGRIKPDIAANGNNHVSTAESQGYRDFGGTSGAAPVVAGVMAMLHEAYEVNQGSRANAALLKAIMLNTATDLGNKGPDFIYGWGSLNGYRAALCIEESRFVSESIQQDEQKTHIITVPENVAELRIMTYWPDPESFSGSPLALLNDLNTNVTSATGTEHLPWVLDHSKDPIKLNTPATKGVDFLNNMEQVAIDNPVSGDYTLEVNGDLVPFGTNEYYVVWEFRMNEIDIIFPDGGENLNFSTTEVIHWDATGDEGTFVISHIDSEGNENQIGEVAGNKKYFQWFTPVQFSESSKIKVSRDGLSDESTEPFVLANNPKNLEVTFDENEPNWLHWNMDTIPVSYSIYRLGDFMMEKVLTIETDSFQIPNEPEYKFAWLAVSANFPNGAEGKRSIAVSTTPQPVALATNDKNNKPCVNQPIIFETQSIDTLLRYHWSFGANSLPEETFTKGPHSVIYTKTGPNLALLNVQNDGGSDDTFFSLFVQSDLTPNETEVTDLGGGEYTFKSKINGANSYSWDFGDGNSGTGKTVTHAYTESGNFTITLEAENSCGIVTEINEVMIDLTSINDLTESDFVISPNPSHGDFEIILPDLEGNAIDIQLLTLEGKLIETKTFRATTPGQKITWNDVPGGIYFMNFKIEAKKLTRKIIVH
jgi:PKD repeat protein